MILHSGLRTGRVGAVKLPWFTLLFVAGTGLTPTQLRAASTPTTQWVHQTWTGNLKYQTTPAGDRIMDFSTAGYMGGGVALPTVQARKTVQPSGSDDTAAIQAAVDAVGAMPLTNGIRGAVLLGPGAFTCSRPIILSKSGVVIRGSGSGTNGTTIKMVGGRHTAFTIGAGRGGGPAAEAATIDENESASEGQTTPRPEANSVQTKMADAYVPEGTTSFTVVDTKGFAVGDTIAIRRPTTPAWVKFMHMDDLVRGGRPQTWIGPNRSGVTERKIIAISKNKLTIDQPLADSYDAQYLNPPGTTVAKIRPPSLISQAGIEHLHIQCPPLEIAYGQAPYSAIRINGEDIWARDVYCEEIMNATALRGRRITMEQVVVTHTYPNLGASKPTDFSIEGSQILLDRCRISGDNMYFVWTASLYPGPNVILNSTFNGRGSRIQPHMRWSTGLLVDNCKVPDGGIDFMNRGVAGSGHGWTMGWAVAWNCVARDYLIQNPPGAANWAIGCIGFSKKTGRMFDAQPVLPEGIFESPGKPVTPQSLYLAQLSKRLGRRALKNIGYSANTQTALADKSLVSLPELPIDSDSILGPDLALHRPINTGNVRGRNPQFGGEKAVDGDPKTYWATDDASTRATLEVDMEGPVDINAAVIEEAEGMQQRVRQYKVEGMGNSDWKLLSQGTTIGERKIDRFPKMTVWKVRLTIQAATPYPAIRKFGLYLEKPGR